MIYNQPFHTPHTEIVGIPVLQHKNVPKYVIKQNKTSLVINKALRLIKLLLHFISYPKITIHKKHKSLKHPKKP